MYLIRFSKQADKDKNRIKAAALEEKVKGLLHIIAENPLQNPPPYEALVGNLSGFYSRRINIQHRLVYSVHPDPVVYEGRNYDGEVYVVRMWTHYDGI